MYILPSSGAAQLKQTGPKIDLFISSYRADIPIGPNPRPDLDVGICGDQSPAALTSKRI